MSIDTFHYQEEMNSKLCARRRGIVQTCSAKNPEGCTTIAYSVLQEKVQPSTPLLGGSPCSQWASSC